MSKRDIDQTNLDLWTISFSIIVGIFILIILFISYGQDYFSDQTGWIGDTVGGITAPFINGLSAILVYRALREQVFANKLVIDQFKKQEIENRFFELIKLHRDNVAEIGINNELGKKVFVILIREFREIYLQLLVVSKLTNIFYKNEQYFEIAYIALYFGVGPNSSRQLKQALNNYDPIYVNLLELRLNDKLVKERIKYERKFKYTPFEGHQSRLGHYFRHLYQTVKFIHEQEINHEQKYAYLKILRAQLTTHEQALLFINSLTALGKNWWKNNLIVKYKLVKNIPLEFFHPENEIILEKYFDDKTYFEYQED